MAVVGDASCGKTSLILSFTDKYNFGEEHVPDVLKKDRYIDIKVKGISTCVCIRDTVGKKFEWQVCEKIFLPTTSAFLCISTVINLCSLNSL